MKKVAVIYFLLLSSVVWLNFSVMDRYRGLLERGEINLINNRGVTPIMEAARLLDEAAVRFLLENGADVNIASSVGNTALIEAVAYLGIMRSKDADSGAQNTIKLLLEYGADLNAANNYQETAFKLSYGLPNTRSILTTAIELQKDLKKFVEGDISFDDNSALKSVILKSKVDSFKFLFVLSQVLRALNSRDKMNFEQETNLIKALSQMAKRIAIHVRNQLPSRSGSVGLIPSDIVLMIFLENIKELRKYLGYKVGEGLYFRDLIAYEFNDILEKLNPSVQTAQN